MKARQMAQQLRTLPALPEDPSLGPSSTYTGQLTPLVPPASVDPMPSFGLLQYPHIHGIQSQTCPCVPINKTKIHF